MPNDISTIIVSDFNVEVLAGLLKNDVSAVCRSAIVAPYGQVYPVLQNIQSYAKTKDGVLVWTQPQNVIPSFHKVLNYESVTKESLFNEVQDFSQWIKNAAQSVSFLIVVGWSLPSEFRGIGPGDYRPYSGMNRRILEMNLKLISSLEDIPNIVFLNPSKWIERVGKFAFNPKLWYMGKIPFDTQVFKEAVQDIKSAILTIKGETKKLIVLDLDQTLWGGVVGDVGWQNVKLGGHDPVGEAYVDFQKTLKAFKNRGIILALASKNDEAIALEAMARHPEMVLKRNDFNAIKINWDDKAQNIMAIAQELNLGLSSIVFIDDHPAERGRVREALPEVFVPEWPIDPMLYKKALLELTCFDTISLTQEDQARVQMYWDEQARLEAKEKIGSQEDWLKSLQVQVKIEPLTDANLERANQLFNKTNQMNLSTRRLSAMEMKSWAESENHRMWTFRVSDKFGDSGLTGIASLAINGEEGMLVDFILSCRVFGRKVEDVMLYAVCEYAATQKVKAIMAKYIPTAKNQPCLEFLKRSGMTTHSDDHVFCWSLAQSYPQPEIHIRK